MKKNWLRKKLPVYKSYVRSRVWKLERFFEKIKRRRIFKTQSLLAHQDLQNKAGKRFLELSALLKEHLEKQLESDPELAVKMGSQLMNVLKHCDEITYEEEGTAQAYALLHFLNRYHRFQLIFAALDEQGILPKKKSNIDILDVGTGPGPSMFATSDFFSDKLSWKPADRFEHGTCPFTIDYVERSSEFRNWLHHFTEHVNYWCPSGLPWQVPFHHGTFFDFRNIEFNRNCAYYERDGDDEIWRKTIQKHRFDIAIFSNFLTTGDQVKSFSKEIEDCARYLRNNGILIIVGAPDRTKKYRAVYKGITEIVLGGKYGQRAFKAHCREVKLANPVLSFSWNDEYGKHIKEFTRQIIDKMNTHSPGAVPSEEQKLFGENAEVARDKLIEWEIRVFRKLAKPRRGGSRTKVSIAGTEQ